MSSSNRTAESKRLNVAREKLEIVPAQLHDDSGVIGAALTGHISSGPFSFRGLTALIPNDRIKIVSCSFSDGIPFPIKTFNP